MRAKRRSDRYAGKTLKEGSCHLAMRMVTERGYEMGLSPCEAKFLGWVAWHGPSCWRDDTVAAAMIPKHADGTTFHPGHIGRVRRKLRRWGLLTSERVMPHHTAPRADYPSPHGTTHKVVNYARLEIRCPMSRGERRARHRTVLAQERRARRAADLVRRGELPAQPLPEPTPRAAMLASLVDPEFALRVQAIGSPAPRTRTRVTSERPIDRERQAEQSADDARAKARADLFAWAKRNERGPP